MSDLAHRVDSFRALRAEIEAGLLPFATSVDMASEGGGDVDAGWASPG